MAQWPRARVSVLIGVLSSFVHKRGGRGHYLHNVASLKEQALAGAAQLGITVSSKLLESFELKEKMTSQDSDLVYPSRLSGNRFEHFL